MTKKAPVKKKPPPPEPEFPEEVYAYFVKTYSYRHYNRPRQSKLELRVVSDITKVPTGKTVAVFKKASLGKVERKVDFTLNKVVK